MFHSRRRCFRNTAAAATTTTTATTPAATTPAATTPAATSPLRFCLWRAFDWSMDGGTTLGSITSENFGEHYTETTLPRPLGVSRKVPIWGICCLA